MAAGRTCPAGIASGNRQHVAAQPNLFVFQLPPELEPPLIEDGFIQARFGFHVTPWRIAAACCGLGHVPYLQILDTHNRVVFADCGRGLVQEVAASIGDARVNLLDAGFRLLPVAAELRLARHGTLIACKPLLVLPEGVERFDVAAIGQRGKARDTHIYTDDAGGRMHRLLNLALGLDAHEPLAAVGRHGDVFCHAENVPAVAVANPTEFRQEDTAVGLVYFELLGIGIAETIVLPFFLEPWKICTLGKEVRIGTLQVLERLL